jgi:hypothetical protein
MNALMIKIAGLYEKTSAKGNRYFVGRLNGARLLMFANTEKQGEKDPDWHLYVQEREESSGQSHSHRGTSETGDIGGISGGDYPISTRRRTAA